MSSPRKLDTLGQVCPLPILLTAKALKELQVGDLLEVVGDDPAIADDMPIFCFRAGHRLLKLDEEETGLVRCTIEKGRTERPPIAGSVPQP